MKIIELEIKNVRGIKDMVLRPDEKNFVVWGTNGSGKSAVVDAIDFVLTGQITRLTGQGTRNITLKKHGAHIDCGDLSQAYVRIVVMMKGVNQPVELYRCLDKPSEINISPKVEEYFLPIQEIAHRGQHVLTRREILRFITAEGGKRAEEIQSLMNLNEVETTRKSIGRVVGTYEKALSNAQRNLRGAKTDVSARIGHQGYKKEEVLRTVNENRAILGGDPISKLASGILKSNLTPPAVLASKHEVNVTILERDLTNIRDVTSEKFGVEIHEKDETLRGLVSTIHEDVSLLRAFSTQKLVNMGIKLLDGSNVCPLCDIEWKPGELKAYLEKKLASAKFVQERVDQIDQVSQSLLDKIEFVILSLGKVIHVTQHLDLEKELIALKNWQSSLKRLKVLLEDPLTKYHRPRYTSGQVKRLLAPETIQDITAQILTATKEKFSESTPEQTAWDILTELGVELKQLEDRQKEYDLAQLSYKRASLLQTEFEKARDEILEKLYNEIKDRFVELYRELHYEDESEFDASLRPLGATLDFEVDFYGRGSHPPHALHSEGHQDSMGVCLFLALSEKLTGGLIDLIILDDVVMSVDSNHRRDLCNLLAENFPGKQFLITTHDRTWAMQLRFNGVVNHDGLYEFFNWSIDTGPHISDIVDLWARIDKDLESNDIPSAAAKLRRGSEQFFAEVCHNLVANVPFRIDGRYELGDLLFSAMGQFSHLLEDAKKASASWGDENPDELQFLDAERKKVYKRLGGEQWAVNINVHFNDWANFERNDFTPVVKAYKDLFALFTCQNCQGMIRVVRDGKDFQNVRCNCDRVNWNLVKKKRSRSLLVAGRPGTS